MKIKSKELWFKSSGHNLYGLFEQPIRSRTTLIILFHGLTNSHTNCPLISEITKLLHENNFPTFRFDYFGSGKSDGMFKDKTWNILVDNTKDTLKYVKMKLNYQRIGIWWRSVGAILGATICDNPIIYASVFLSMTVHTNKSFALSFPKEQAFSSPIIGTAKVKGKPVLSYKFYEETKWIDELQKEHLEKAKNILIIQGTRDKTVYNPLWAKEIYDLTNEPKKLIYIKGANHAYIGYEQNTINEGIRWFTRLV